jgi:predicted PurR-regulated permease PerM
MAKIVSFIVLVVILLLIGGLFLQVMAGFLLPLFLAMLLVVIFGPLNRWFRRRCGKHERIAAMLTTVSIMLLVLIPMLVLLLEAGLEARAVYLSKVDEAAVADSAPSEIAEKPRGQVHVFGQDPAAKNDESPKNGPVPVDEQPPTEIEKFIHSTIEKVVDFGKKYKISLDGEEMESNIDSGVQKFLAPLALRTTQFLGQAILGFFVMILATYYFFADGAVMIVALKRLLPLDNRRTEELIDQFDSVTRAVVVATLLSAFVQGLLAGAGYYVAGIGSIFLLTALSMLFALVPFVGAAAVWVPVCLWLLAEGRTTAAIGLAVYCIVVVSMVDNVVKPLVLHGRSNLHPLLALLSVLGGVQVLGPIGILVGPMVVAFLQTLLNMVHTELNSMTKEQGGAKPQAG